jgi:hypothetical protein
VPAVNIRVLNAKNIAAITREFQRARSQPRHLVPQPMMPSAHLRAGIDGIIGSLLAAQHVLEIFRRALPNGLSRSCLDRLSNRRKNKSFEQSRSMLLESIAPAKPSIFRGPRKPADRENLTSDIEPLPARTGEAMRCHRMLALRYHPRMASESAR